jgi:uncharacterized membrane protein YqjE
MSDGAHSAGTRTSPGVLASLRGLVATAIAITHTRLQLLANDLEEQRIRTLNMIVLAAVAFFCGSVGILLVSAWLVIALWDDYRLLTLGVLAAGYFAACAVALIRLKSRLLERPRVFASSLAELRRDEELLRS